MYSRVYYEGVLIFMRVYSRVYYEGVLWGCLVVCILRVYYEGVL